MTPTSEQTHSNSSAKSAETERLQKRLGEVAEKLRVVFSVLTEIENEYPELWDFIQKVVHDQLDPRNKIPEGMDLGTWAKARGAVSSEEFLQELEKIP